MDGLLVLFIGFVIAIIWILLQSSYKRKKLNEEWTGQVLSIFNLYGNSQEGEEDWVLVDYLTDSGLKGKTKVPYDIYRQRFDSLRAGDRIAKRRGEKWIDRMR